MKGKIIPFLSVLLLATTLTGCNTGENFPVYDGSRTEYYNSNWKPGSQAIKNANQPKVKNPKGITVTLNEIRRSQDKVALPAQGSANILVVPVAFKNDNKIEKQTGLDLTYSTSDIEGINHCFFGNTQLNKYATVKDYYEKSSFGKLSLSGVVTPVVTMPEEFMTYISRISSQVSTTEQIHIELMEYIYHYLFKETETYYIGDFDSDNDRRIDNIQLLINYPFGLATGDTPTDNALAAFLGYDNVYFHNSFSHSEAPVNSFVVTSEYVRRAETSTTSVGDGKSSHIAVYQTALALGLDELGDLTGNVTGEYYRAPMGFADMLDAYVGDHNLFSKYQLGWVSPKLIKLDDIKDETLVLELKPSATSGEAIILYTGEHSAYGEYLLLDYYTTDGLNKFDSKNTNIFGVKALNTSGVRLLQVDSRLIEGYGATYYPLRGDIDFNKTVSLVNGEKAKYTYAYMNTNNGINNYYGYGISSSYPLVSILDKNGLNRHIVRSDYAFDGSSLFKKGDTFGSEDQVDGFYKNFKFHGDGVNKPQLNISFEITDLTTSSATITFKGVK